jgi:RNA polymerase sigma factor (sigma-70 family)
MDDQKLLREYAHSGSQSAFRILVDRHLGMVYSAAKRMVHDSQLAEGVTQSVFTTLAKKGDSINPSEVLARWLHDTTRRLAAHALLTASQRREHEHAATAPTPGPGASAGRVVDELEAMMDKLSPADRDAIVLRYLENRSLHDVAETLRLSEEAARARINHTVEQLHARFSEKGVPISSAVLASILSSESVAHVPTGLAIAVSTEALEAAATVPAQGAAGSWWNMKTAIPVAIAVLLACIGTFFLQQTRVNQLQSENQRLLADKRKMKAEYDVNLSSAARGGNIELVRLRRSNDELLRLRREVTQLRKTGETAPPTATPEPPPPAITPSGPHEPGTFISREQLGFVGFTTPEAAMESVVWSMVNGNYDAFLTALSPEDREEQINNPDGREFFEAGRQRLAPQFKGMQVFALKVLGDDEVEIKVRLDYDSPLFQIQPLVKINDQWRLADSTRDYDLDWDNSGEIHKFTP